MMNGLGGDLFLLTKTSRILGRENAKTLLLNMPRVLAPQNPSQSIFREEQGINPS